MAMRLNSFKFTEDVFDQVAPYVHFGIERDWPGPPRMLRDDNAGPPFVEIGDDFVAVEGFVCEQCTELDALDERRYADAIEAVAGHQVEADKVAQSVCQSEDFGRHAAFGTANGLATGPPFAPCP